MWTTGFFLRNRPSAQTRRQNKPSRTLAATTGLKPIMHLAAADGTKTIVTADTVVLAVGTNRNPDFHEELTARGIEYHVAGDSAENSPGTIAGAIHDGFWAGMKV